MDIDEAFDKFTEIEVVDGDYEVNCIRGNWGVGGWDREAVIKDAKRLFAEYYATGAYVTN